MIFFVSKYKVLLSEKWRRIISNSLFIKNEVYLMNDIFARIRDRKEKSFFKNESIFRTDYTTLSLNEVIGREEEKHQIIKFFHDTIEKGLKSEINIVGTIGVGKTYLVRAILEEVKRQYADNEKVNFYSSWVNCKQFYPVSKFKFQNAILRPLGHHKGKGYGDQDTSNELKSICAEAPFIVVLDEVDAIATFEEGNLLYELLEIPHLSLVMISNDFNWTDKTDMRVQSRAQANRLDFTNYSYAEMFHVLSFISSKGLKDGVLHDIVLKQIAELTKDEFLGDVRKGKNLMYSSAERAMTEDAHGITLKHVEESIKNVDRMTLALILTNFEKPELVALASIVSVRYDVWKKEEERVPSTMAIHKMFEKNCEKHGVRIVTETQMKNYLKRLVESKVIYYRTGSLKTRGRVNYYYSVYSPEELYNTLTENGVEPWTEMTADKYFR